MQGGPAWEQDGKWEHPIQGKSGCHRPSLRHIGAAQVSASHHVALGSGLMPAWIVTLAKVVQMDLQNATAAGIPCPHPSQGLGAAASQEQPHEDVAQGAGAVPRCQRNPWSILGWHQLSAEV